MSQFISRTNERNESTEAGEHDASEFDKMVQHPVSVHVSMKNRKIDLLHECCPDHHPYEYGENTERGDGKMSPVASQLSQHIRYEKHENHKDHGNEKELNNASVLIPPLNLRESTSYLIEKRLKIELLVYSENEHDP